jgi:hypothetical protein
LRATECVPSSTERPGEVVAVKGGHIVDGSAVAGLPDDIRNSAL